MPPTDSPLFVSKVVELKEAQDLSEDEEENGEVEEIVAPLFTTSEWETLVDELVAEIIYIPNQWDEEMIDIMEEDDNEWGEEEEVMESAYNYDELEMQAINALMCYETLNESDVE